MLLSTSRDKFEGGGGFADASTELANADVEFPPMVDGADLLLFWEQGADCAPGFSFEEEGRFTLTLNFRQCYSVDLLVFQERGAYGAPGFSLSNRDLYSPYRSGAAISET